MDLRWLLTSLALSFPAVAQDAPAVEEAPAAAPAAAPTTQALAQEAPKPAAPPAEGPSAPAAPAPTSAAAPVRSETATAAEPATPESPAAPSATTANAPKPGPAASAPVAAPRAPAVSAPAPRPPSHAHADHGHDHGAPSGFGELTRNTESDEERVQKMARVAFDRILAGDARFVVRGSGFPFYLDARRIEDQETLFRELLQQLRSRRLDLLSVDAIRVFTPAQMEATYGPPPARLAHLPWKGPQTWIAVANLSNRAAVAIFQNTRAGWQLIAYTD